MRVLTAEDSAVTRRILREAVESLGHECLEATDGAAAWALYLEAGADAIISDWIMPGMDGPELCRQVRAHTCDTTCGPHPPYTYFKLALTVGYTEIIGGADDLPQRLRPAAREAHRGARDAARIVHQLQQVIELRETDWGVRMGTTINLDESTSSEPFRSGAQ